VNPMIVWLWIGGGVMALGTVLALAPRLRRPTRPAARARDLPEGDPEPDLTPGSAPSDGSEPLEGVPA